ncbi:MAG: hemerythrin domain-containing protein [Mycobacterium sp.]
MPDESLSAALEREHHEIDAGIEAFLEKLDGGSMQPEPLTGALEALRRHIYLEERILFPPIREGGLVMPLFVMMREHGEIWRAMDALTDTVADGADSDKLVEACQQLLRQLEAHNMKEEPVIYPHADTSLTPEKATELADFIKTGLTPDGWVCQEAG